MRTRPRLRRALVALVLIELSLLVLLVAGIGIAHILEPTNATPP